MSRQIADNLNYKGKKFIDERGQIATIADLKAITESYYPNGFVTYCVEDSAYYRYDELNIADEFTGKWQKIGGVVTHPETLPAGARTASIFTRNYGAIAAPSITITDPVTGGYVSPAPDQTFPFNFANVTFTSANEVAMYDGANWVITKMPQEGEIHIFPQYVTKYTKTDGSTYPVDIENYYKIADKALAAGWSLTPHTDDNSATIKVSTVLGYTKDGTPVVVGNKMWRSTDSNVLTFSAEGATYLGVLVPYADITVDTVKEWENSGAIKSVLRDATYFTQNPEWYMAHIKTDKSFVWLPSLTPIYSPFMEFDIEDLGMSQFKDALASECIEQAFDGPIAHLYMYSEDRFATRAQLITTTTPSGWVFDSEGFWTKIFPADFELNKYSTNPIANGIVTRAISAAGHRLEMSYESDVKVLTAVLYDKASEEISKVAVCIGGPDESSNPKCTLEANETLFKKGTSPTITFTATLTTGSDPIDHADLIKKSDGTVLHTWTSGSEIDPDLPAQEVETAVDTIEDVQDIFVIVYDTKSLFGKSEEVHILFVDPCLHNPMGGAAVEETLSKDGEALFKFDFTVAEGSAEPVMADQAVIKIPRELEDVKPVIAILGGVTKEHLYTDYTESFERVVGEDPDLYVTYTLKDACGLKNFYFKTLIK